MDEKRGYSNQSPVPFQWIRQSLIDKYFFVLREYCNSTGLNFPIQLLFLSNPFYFFILKRVGKGREKKDEIFCAVPLHYIDPETQALQTINKITEDTYHILFTFYGLPCNNDELITSLFYALRELLTNYLYQRSEAFFNQIKRLSPFTAIAVAELIEIQQGNVYLRDKFHKFSSYNFYPALCLPKEEYPQDVPLALLNRYLKARIKEWKPNYSEDDLRSKKAPSKYILYRHESSNSFVKLLRETDVEGLHYATVSLPPAPDYPEKTIKAKGVPPILSDSVKEILYFLTGGKTELLDRLAVLFADAASANLPPKKKKAAIISSRINEWYIPALIYALLDGVEIKQSIAKKYIIDKNIKPLKSANRYCSQSGLQRLFYGQGNGYGAEVLNDTPISDTSLPVFKKLIHGEKLSFKVPNFPKQHLYSDTFFIFISNDPKKAKKLRDQIHCELIDLTNDELAQFEFFKLSATDIAWLQKVFLPHGLIADEQKEMPRKVACYSDTVEEFIKTQCKKGRNEKCTRKELYDSYVAYYQWKHTDNKPKLTIGRFVKAVNDLIKNDPQISYQKLRSTQSRYFIGISCQTDFSTFPKPKLPNKDSFLEYLEQINKTYSHLLDQKPTASESKSGLIVEYRRTSDSEVKQEKSP